VDQSVALVVFFVSVLTLAEILLERDTLTWMLANVPFKFCFVFVRFEVLHLVTCIRSNGYYYYYYIVTTNYNCNTTKVAVDHLY